MFAKSSEEGIFKYLCISAYSLLICKVKEKLVLEKFNHIFLSGSQRALFFLSMSQRAIEFSFQKHYSAIASIS